VSKYLHHVIAVAAAVIIAAVLSCGTALAALPPVPSSAASVAAVHPDAHRNVKAALAGHKSKAVCAPAAPGRATCNAVKDEVVGGTLAVSAVPAGYAPTDLQAAYKLPSSTNGAGMTVAVVDAYGNPGAEADLGVYRAKYGLPPCTAANGCFTRLDQRGGTAYPASDPGWTQETSLDLDVVSAACPLCKIMLVEADTPSLDDLGAAVDISVARGAGVVSNSYGAPSDSSDPSFDAYFNHPGVAITASSGDEGYGAEYPAASPHVTAVGGTSLSLDAGARGWAETAWAGAGSGCSAASAKPPWQADTGCATRTVTDVSAVADPQTGVAAYDAADGWMVMGGTSVSAPLIAAVYALAGPATPGSAPGAFPYAHPDQLNDVTGGSNGNCGTAYLCSAQAGYDGPTGLGTPSGVGAFTSPPVPPTPTPTPSPTPTPTPPPAVRAITTTADTVYADSAGRLFDAPATGKGAVGTARQIGTGFSGVRDMHVTDWNSDGIADLLVQWTSGRVNVYLGTAKGLVNGPVIAASGWSGITLTVGKWQATAPYPWLVGTNAAGGLYYWANRHGTTVDTAVKIGTGWSGLKFTQLDYDADGNVDLLVRRSTGVLQLYRGNGAGQVVNETRKTIGTGWQGFDSLSAVQGFAGSGSRGIIARNASSGIRYYYPVLKGAWGARAALVGSWKNLSLAD